MTPLASLLRMADAALSNGHPRVALVRARSAAAFLERDQGVSESERAAIAARLGRIESEARRTLGETP